MGRHESQRGAVCEAFAPGRVNLIGEHTDYNGGLALPCAIAAGVRVTARPGSEAGIVNARAQDVEEEDRFALTDPGSAEGWRAFVRGVVAELGRAGVRVPAAELEIRGDVPRGAGLSSSAALEVALCLGLLGLAGDDAPEALQVRSGTVADPLALARLCSRVENDWVGAQSGLMDQLASIASSAGHALLIDFATDTWTSVPLDLGDYHLVAVSSGQSHSLNESGYNDRRRECHEAADALGLESLREASLDAVDALPEPLNRRARHVVCENARVREAVDALEAGDLRSLGALINASHASQRDLYEVSTPEVEATVTALLDHGAIGARIVGGGFGGSVLGLLGPGVAIPEDALVLEAGPGAHLLSGSAG